MAIQVDVDEAKARFSELLERAHAGEDVVTPKVGKPCARLGPILDEGDRRPGTFRGRISGEIVGPMGSDDSPWG